MEQMEGNLFRQAEAIVAGDRGGYPEDVFTSIAKYWGTYLDIEIHPRDVAVMMILLKIARLHPDIDKYNPDNAVDIMGYAYFLDVYSTYLKRPLDEENDDECLS